MVPSKQAKKEREGNIIKYDHMYNIAMLHNICVYISVAWVGDRPSFAAGREAPPRSNSTQPWLEVKSHT